MLIINGQRTIIMVFCRVIQKSMREQGSCYLLGLYSRNEFFQVLVKGQTLSWWGCTVVRVGQRLFFKAIHFINMLVHHEMLSLNPARCIGYQSCPGRSALDRSLNGRSRGVKPWDDWLGYLESWCGSLAHLILISHDALCSWYTTSSLGLIRSLTSRLLRLLNLQVSLNLMKDKLC